MADSKPPPWSAPVPVEPPPRPTEPPSTPPPGEGRSVFEDIATATVLKPGDRLLISLNRRFLTRQEMDEVRAYFDERLPGVPIALLADATVTVIPADDRAADG